MIVAKTFSLMLRWISAIGLNAVGASSPETVRAEKHNLRKRCFRAFPRVDQCGDMSVAVQLRLSCRYWRRVRLLPQEF